MSKPENPLAKYRTYSYHFILGLTDNTTDARKFLSEPRFQSLPRTGRVTQREIDGATNVAPLINSKTDSDYIIEEFKMTNRLTPKGGGSSPDTHGMFNAEATMTVREPRGVNFLNDLRRLHGNFMTDPAGSVFVLQIQFVGHEDAGMNNTGPMAETVIETVGIQLVMANIEAKFDVAGSSYEIQFVAAVNGLSRMPHVTQGLKRSSIETATSLKLGAAFQRLQTQANNLYNERFDNVTKERQKQGARKARPGNRVQYLLDPGPFADCDLTEHLPSQGNDGNHKDESGNFNFGKKKNVDSLMIDMALFCSEILEETTAKEGENSESVFVPNVVSVKLSGQDAKDRAAEAGINGDVDELMVYQLVRHKQAVTTNDLRQQAARGDIDPGNSIIFDYFYTGENTDVLDFELNLNMGLAFVTGVTTTPNRGAQGTTGTEDPENQKTSEQTQTQDMATCNTPWYPDQPSTVAKKRYTGSPEAQINARTALAKAAGYEMLGATMKITGNPILLANLNPDQLDLLNGKPREAQTTPAQIGSTAPTLDVNKDWATRKGFIKVNLFTMDNAEDDSLDPEFRKSEFWYNGYYELLEVESELNDGQFTQTLTMMSLPFAFPTKPDGKRRTPAEKMAEDSADQGNLAGNKHESFDLTPPDQQPEE